MLPKIRNPVMPYSRLSNRRIVQLISLTPNIKLLQSKSTSPEKRFLFSKPKVLRDFLLDLLLNPRSIGIQVGFIQTNIYFYLLQDGIVNVVSE